MRQHYNKMFFLMLGFSVFTSAGVSSADSESFEKLLHLGFTNVDVVSLNNISKLVVDADQASAEVAGLCQALKAPFKKYGWEEDPCGKVQWQAHLKSKKGHPLIYAEFGSGEEVTLILGGVHPDELTPIPMAFRFARHIMENPGTIEGRNARVIVAPLVNPDGWFLPVPSRTNANGIDPNRNFFTMDWYERSKRWWQDQRSRSPRHFPGYFPNSEVETLFQIQLVEDYRPDKIISIHAPLGFLDYDGPGDGEVAPPKLTQPERKAKQLVHEIAQKSRNYRVVDYSFYPGSLGNFAGNERKIPTITLELETTDVKKLDTYWNQFLPGLLQSVQYPFKTQTTIGVGNATVFYGRNMNAGLKNSDVEEL